MGKYHLCGVYVAQFPSPDKCNNAYERATSSLTDSRYDEAVEGFKQTLQYHFPYPADTESGGRVYLLIHLAYSFTLNNQPQDGAEVISDLDQYITDLKIIQNEETQNFIQVMKNLCSAYNAARGGDNIVAESLLTDSSTDIHRDDKYLQSLYCQTREEIKWMQEMQSFDSYSPKLIEVIQRSLSKVIILETTIKKEEANEIANALHGSDLKSLTLSRVSFINKDDVQAICKGIKESNIRELNARYVLIQTPHLQSVILDILAYLTHSNLVTLTVSEDGPVQKLIEALEQPSIHGSITTLNIYNYSTPDDSVLSKLLELIPKTNLTKIKLPPHYCDFSIKLQKALDANKERILKKLELTGAAEDVKDLALRYAKLLLKLKDHEGSADLGALLQGGDDICYFNILQKLAASKHDEVPSDRLAGLVDELSILD